MEDVWDLYESRSGFDYIGIIRDWICDRSFMGRNTARLRKRGFNQSILLAHYFRKNLIDHVHPIYPHWLRRTRATRPQTEL